MIKFIKILFFFILLLIIFVIFDMTKINITFINKPLLEINKNNINSSFIKYLFKNYDKVIHSKDLQLKFTDGFNPLNNLKDSKTLKSNRLNFTSFKKNEKENNSSNWFRSHGNYQSNRFSSLNQINTSNIGNLEKTWEFSFEKKFNKDVQCNPIIKEGIIYTPTSAGSVVALKGDTGDLLWEVKGFSSSVARRGLLISDDNLIYFSDNKNLVSINSKNGSLNKNFGKKGKVRLTGSSVVAPVIYKNYIITVTFNKSIEAFDKKNGQSLWKFSFQDPNNNKKVYGKKYNNIGGNPWGGISLDVERGILFITTGNPYNYFDGTSRPGINRYSNSIIAFDINKKNILWDFQEVFHDIWNLDIPAPPILTSITLDNNKKIDVVVAVTKLGNTLIFDRVTGENLFDINYKKVLNLRESFEKKSNIQIDLKLPEPFSRNLFSLKDVTDRDEKNRNYVLKKIEKYNFGFFKSYEIGKKNVQFNFHGGAEWPGASVDHENEIMYVTSNEIAWITELKKNNKFKNKFTSYYIRLKDLDGYPGTKPPWGKLTAIKLSTGKILWQRPFGNYNNLKFYDKNGKLFETGTENFGGVTGSKGGLLFATGTLDHKFYIFESSTGKKLGEFKLPYIGSAPPSVYEVGGYQYILINSTGSISLKKGYPDQVEFGNKFIAYSLRKTMN